MRYPLPPKPTILAFVCLALLTTCGSNAADVDDSAKPVGAGKADNPFVSSPDLKAPEWLLAPQGSGTWTDDENDPGVPAVVYAWVDAKVVNRRFDKRVFVEVAQQFAGGAIIRTLHPTKHKGALGSDYEVWGTDAVEIYPDGGPNGSALKEPVLYRLRMQEDPDDDGVDQMVITDWYALYGEGEDWLPAPDEWLPLWDSPVATGAGEVASPQAFYTPFDDAGAAVVDLIEEVISAKLADPEGRHTIHAAVFNINDPRIADKLIAAHQTGVEVRLITDGSKLSPVAYWQTEDDRLLAAGVPLLGVGRMGNGAMHTKFSLFDGRKLTTGSFNWEVGSSTENHENMILTQEPELISAYARRFETIAALVRKPRKFAKEPFAEVSVSFAPDEDPYRIMGRLIDDATESVHVAMFTCKDVEYQEKGETTSIFAKLGDAVKRGLEVTVITDYGIAEAAEYYGVMSEDDQQDEYLQSLGVSVVLADNTFGEYSSMHHKFSVIDRKVLVTGAFNWYYDAAFLNDEDQVIWRNEPLALDFLGEFVDLLRRYDPDYDAGHWPQVALTFEVTKDDTQFGDTLYLVGDLPELGKWDPAKAVEFDSSDWPLWRTELTLPAGVRAEYKLIIKHEDGKVTWTEGPNQTLRVPTGTTEHLVTGSF